MDTPSARHAAAPPVAGIYCRLSYAPDGSVEAVERQEADCRDLAGRIGWSIADRHVYVDNSRSAWQRNRKRPAWDRMLADLEAGKIASIIVWHGDRLMRQPWDLERLISISDQRGVRIASIAGTRDLDNADDRFILRIEVAAACRSSDDTSRRIHRKIAEQVINHGRSASAGGKRPFGYGVQIGVKPKIHPATGDEIKVPVWDTDQQNQREAAYGEEAAERLLAGQSQGSVVRWLRSEGVTTTTGGEMTTRGLRHILLAPRSAGLILYKGALYPAAWDGFLSRETWEDVRALFRRNAEAHPYAGRERRYLLSGADGAQCYACGGTVRVKPSGGRNRKNAKIYTCATPGCRKVGRSLAHLDAYVAGRTLRLLQDPRFLDQVLATADRSDVASEIAAVERRRDQTQAQLDALADHPDVDVTAALKGLASFERRLQELRADLAATAQQRLLLRMAGISREQWEDEPIDVRAATVRALWRVVILPAVHRGPGFAPASVRMERRPLHAGVAEKKAHRE